MKRTIIALAVFMAIAAAVGRAMALTLDAPFYNEKSGWTTYIIATGDKGGVTNGTFTVTFYSSTGAALASTSNSVTASTGPWVHPASEFITQNTDSSIGSIEITEGSAGVTFNDVNFIVAVVNDTYAGGFMIPLLPTASHAGMFKYGTGF